MKIVTLKVIQLLIGFSLILLYSCSNLQDSLSGNWKVSKVYESIITEDAHKRDSLFSLLSQYEALQIRYEFLEKGKVLKFIGSNQMEGSYEIVDKGDMDYGINLNFPSGNDEYFEVVDLKEQVEHGEVNCSKGKGMIDGLSEVVST